MAMHTSRTRLVKGFNLAHCAALLLLSACATQRESMPEKQIRPDVMTPAYESRAILLKWYDNTYKTFYDVRGPVRELKLKPIMMLAPISGGTDAEIETVLQFDQQGRLQVSDEHLGAQLTKTRYFYFPDGRPDKIEQFENDALHRVLNYDYKNNSLENTVIHDMAANKVTHIRHKQIPRRTSRLSENDSAEQNADNPGNDDASGWYDLSLPVEEIDVIHANEFDADGTLLWSSTGGFNNGLGYYYLIKTNDEVISSSVKWRGDFAVLTSGGYHFEHDDDGRLTTVVSLGADGGGVYHTTYYRYGEFGLLQSEQKQVSGKSLFNRAADEEVEYTYHELDRYGNWLSRSVVYTTKEKTTRFHQHREIAYY